MVNKSIIPNIGFYYRILNSYNHSILLKASKLSIICNAVFVTLHLTAFKHKETIPLFWLLSSKFYGKFHDVAQDNNKHTR